MSLPRRSAAKAGRCVTAAIVCLATVASAQTGIVNARIETRSASRGLTREIDAVIARGTPAWFGYRVTMARRPRATLVSTGNNGRCHLEPATELLVLGRVEDRRLVEFRSSSVDCDLDAGGMPMVWLTDVNADESVAWLRTLIGTPVRSNDTVMSAIAMHDGQSASATLVALAKQDARSDVRSKALFWLAQRASTEAAATIAGAIDNDPDEDVKKKAVFALSQLPRDEAVTRLIDVARTNKTPGVRRQAMFWLGQTNDPRAIDFFSSILLK